MHLTEIHCHLLPGVDDGPDTVREAANLLKRMREDGVRRIIVTPHYRPEMFETSMQRIGRQYQGMKRLAGKQKIQLFLGCEFYRSEESLKLLNRRERPALANSSYVLMEFAPTDVYQTIWNYVSELSVHGWKPVIAHVERYECCRKDIGLVKELSELGARIQVNAGAVMGGNGMRVKRFCRKLMDEDLIDFIASDAHDEKRRQPNLGECARYVTKKYGQEYAHRIFVENPEKILRDRRRK